MLNIIHDTSFICPIPVSLIDHIPLDVYEINPTIPKWRDISVFKLDPEISTLVGWRYSL